MKNISFVLLIQKKYLYLFHKIYFQLSYAVELDPYGGGIMFEVVAVDEDGVSIIQAVSLIPCGGQELTTCGDGIGDADAGLQDCLLNLPVAMSKPKT